MSDIIKTTRKERNYHTERIKMKEERIVEAKGNDQREKHVQQYLETRGNNCRRNTKESVKFLIEIKSRVLP